MILSRSEWFCLLPWWPTRRMMQDETSLCYCRRSTLVCWTKTGQTTGLTVGNFKSPLFRFEQPWVRCVGCTSTHCPLRRNRIFGIYVASSTCNLYKHLSRNTHGLPSGNISLLSRWQNWWRWRGKRSSAWLKPWGRNAATRSIHYGKAELSTDSHPPARTGSGYVRGL